MTASEQWALQDYIPIVLRSLGGGSIVAAGRVEVWSSVTLLRTRTRIVRPAHTVTPAPPAMMGKRCSRIRCLTKPRGAPSHSGVVKSDLLWMDCTQRLVINISGEKMP